MACVIVRRRDVIVVSVLRHRVVGASVRGDVGQRRGGNFPLRIEAGIALVELLEVGLEGGPRAGVAIDTYLDHRMAMAFSLAGDVTIRDPGCVNKTYPRYFEELAKLGMCDPKVASEVPE